LPQFAFPLLGAMGLQQLIYGGESKEAAWKKFRMAVFVMGGLFVLLAGYYFSADYKHANDVSFKQNIVNGKMQQLSRGAQPTPEIQQQAAATGNAVIKGLEQDRQSVFGSDLVRSIILVVLAVVLMGLYLKDKYKSKYILLGGLLVLSSYDLIGVGLRYLNEDSFAEPSELEGNMNPTTADLQILKDPEKGFRVFNESGGGNAPYMSTQESARTSYLHNSIGGYSPAKLGLYQDLIENQLEKGNMRVFSMLNTKYFVQTDPNTRQEMARLNAGAYGPAWLVKAIHYVKDGNEEMKALDSINTRDTVIIQEKFRDQVKAAPVPDSGATISLIANHNDTVSYKFSAKTGQFAVFSEIYYNKGWKAFVDGVPADYLRVDYLLRGMSVPAGDHTIEFRFEPHSYAIGNTITVITSLLGWVLVIGAVVVEIRKKQQPKTSKTA
ncbi:MAG TPA: YfhO family protein, partial [Puia sp.]|nr:YfhO family protein [Puia sp.]